MAVIAYVLTHVARFIRLEYWTGRTGVLEALTT